MFKTIGIFAHVDGGKTTFSEQLLYKNGSIRNLGRVDNQTAFLDCDNIEKERGITVFAEQASFDYNRYPWAYRFFSRGWKNNVGFRLCYIDYQW